MRRLRAAAAIAVGAMALTFWLTGKAKGLAALGVGMGVWIAVGALFDIALRVRIGAVPFSESLRRAANLPRSTWGGAIAHGALGIVILGIVGTTLWASERVLVMKPGDRVEIAGFELAYEGLEQKRTSNYETEEATFGLIRDGKRIDTLHPERRWYPVAEMQTTEAAIRLQPLHDIYLVIGDPRDTAPDARVVRLYHHPLVGFIWGGALLMVFGGILSLTDRRYRIGAPARKPKAAPQMAPAE